MTKRAAQWSAVLLIGAVLVAFIWVALKGANIQSRDAIFTLRSARNCE